MLKSDGLFTRLIINPKVNLSSSRPMPFAVASPRLLIDMLQKSPWTSSADYRNYFYTLPLPKDAAALFVVRLFGKFYAVTRQPMGWSHVPAAAQALSCYVAGSPFRNLSVSDNALVIIDNTLLLDSSRQRLHERVHDFATRASSLNIPFGEGPSEPSLQGVHGGIAFDTTASGLTWGFKSSWAPKIASDLRLWLAFPSASVRSACRVLGLLLWGTRVSDAPEFIYQPMVTWLSPAMSSGASLDSSLPITHPVRELVRAFASWVLRAPRFARCPVPTLVVCGYSDASLGGYGLVWGRSSGDWRVRGKRWRRSDYESGDITYLEAQAAYRWVFVASSTGAALLQLGLDNDALVSALMAMRSPTPRVNRLVVRIYQRLAETGCRLRVFWIASCRNPADGPSRGLGVSIGPFYQPHIPLLPEHSHPVTSPKSLLPLLAPFLLPTLSPPLHHTSLQ